MKTLSAVTDKAEYTANMGKECVLGKHVVTVRSYTNDSQSGSYMRGFKFSTNTYGYLTRLLKGTKYYQPKRYSPDHGATWYKTYAEMKKQRAGKVKLESSNSKEFAFDAIQRINREYDRNYAW